MNYIWVEYDIDSVVNPIIPNTCKLAKDSEVTIE